MERKTSNTKYDFGEFSEKARKALEKMKATQRPGERGGQVKKTEIIESMKTEIRAMLDDGYSAQQIADALSNSVFPVLPKTITQIAQGTTKTRRYFGKPLISKVDSAMIKELRRVGGLLKHVHNESDGAYSKQTASMLVQLSDLIKKLGSDIL